MRAFILTVSALVLAAATPAGAGLFGNNNAKPAKPVAQSTPSELAPEDTFTRATPEQIQAELRAEPLAQAAFFARQFQHDPKNAKIGLYLSDAQRAIGQYDDAANTAHDVLLFAPDNSDALLAAARAHIEGGHAFYAIDPLKHLSELKSNDWQAWSLLGVAYDQTKRPDDAQAAWQTALKLSPNNAAVLTNMAMSRLTAGDFAGAEPLLRTAVAQKNSTMQERQDLALVLGLQGKMAEAEKLLRQDLPPEAADANLAWLQQTLQSHAQASAPQQPATTPVAAAAAASPSRSWNALKATGG